MRYFSEFVELYGVVELTANQAEDFQPLATKPVRCGGDKYAKDPYLNRLTFQMLNQTDDFVELIEFTEHFDSAKPVIHNTEVIFRIPKGDLGKIVELTAITEPIA